MALFAASIFSCSNTADSNTGIISVRISQGGQQTVKVAADQINFNHVAIVLGSIKFLNTGDDSIQFKSDDPLLVPFDTIENSFEIGSVAVAPGTYDRTIYKIKSVLPNDTAIINEYPIMEGKSIYCDGYVDGHTDSTFEWSSDLVAVQAYTFDDPITVNAGDSVHVTLIFDTQDWFVDTAGGYYDPRQTLSANDNAAVENNIGDAFRAVED